MRSIYIIFLAIIAIFAVLSLSGFSRTIKNDDLMGNAAVIESHRVIISRYYSQVSCFDQTMKSFGYPTTGLPCTSVEYCQDYWPAGVSYQVRDSKAVCCNDAGSEGFGECGQWVVN
jgi:hypothetical protein